MNRSQQEVRDFLNSQVGLSVNAKSGVYKGQCVSLIKALMEFLGVPDPYAARGDAKDAGNRYLKDGIAKDGAGWLTIVINPNMGGGYGHIWVDLKGEANFEQNGAIALHTTKNTRPYNQGVQYINFDQWLKGDGMQEQDIANIINEIWGTPANANNIRDYTGMSWHDFIYNILGVATPWQDRKNNFTLVSQQNTQLKERIKELESQSGKGEFTKVGELYTKK